MRSNGIVLATPGLDHDARLTTRAEPLGVQALITQPSVERFVGAVLPRLARIDVNGLNLLLGDPSGLLAPPVAAGLIAGGANIVTQLVSNGGDLAALDIGQVGTAAVVGALLPGSGTALTNAING
jgi:hypothetical protein